MTARGDRKEMTVAATVYRDLLDDGRTGLVMALYLLPRAVTPAS